MPVVIPVTFLQTPTNTHTQHMDTLLEKIHRWFSLHPPQFLHSVQRHDPAPPAPTSAPLLFFSSLDLNFSSSQHTLRRYLAAALLKHLRCETPKSSLAPAFEFPLSVARPVLTLSLGARWHEAGCFHGAPGKIIFSLSFCDETLGESLIWSG